MKLTERLGKEWIFFDGGMGTILQEHGLKAGELPETWNLSHPDEIIALNRSYFEAGCDVVNTNTFGANALKYPDNLQEIVQAAVSAGLRSDVPLLLGIVIFSAIFVYCGNLIADIIYNFVDLRIKEGEDDG